MATPNVGTWVRVGLLALPLYGLLTLWTTFIHQPNPNTNFEAYARYVSTTNYLVDHLLGSPAISMRTEFAAKGCWPRRVVFRQPPAPVASGDRSWPVRTSGAL